MSEKRQSFIKGAFVLSAATIIVKIIGALFKIPLGNLIEPGGMAYFSLAFDSFSVLYVVTTAGLPVAVSKMVAESEARGRRRDSRSIFRLSFISLIVIGALASTAMVLFARDIARAMGNENAYAAMLAIAPAVFFSAVSTAFRGYFQGKSNMTPTAVSQVIEACGKLFVGYGLAAWVYGTYSDPVWAAAAAVFGVSAGSAASVAYLGLSNIRRRRGLSAAAPGTPKSELFSRMWAIALPVTISSSLLSLTNWLDSAIALRRLQEGAGFSQETATFIKGAYVYAQSLYLLPPALVVTLAVSVVPELSRRLAVGDRAGASRTVETGLRMTALLALPASAGYIALSEPILQMLYGSRHPEAVSVAAPLLQTLGFAIIFVCLAPLCSSILQSMGMVYMPIATMLGGGVVKVIISYILIGDANINIAGAPVSTAVGYGLTSIVSIVVIMRKLGIKKAQRLFIRPLLASAVMGVAARVIYLGLVRFMENTPAVLISVLSGVVLYALLAFYMRALPESDAQALYKRLIKK